MSDSPTGGNGQVAGLDIVVQAPGAQQARNDAVGALKDITAAAKENATAVDRNTQATVALTDAQREEAKQANLAARSKADLTKAQQDLQQRIDSLAQSMSNMDRLNAASVQRAREQIATNQKLAESIGATKAQTDQLTGLATSTNAVTDSTRQMTLTQMAAIEMDEARTASLIANRAATEAASTSTGVHGLQLGRLNMELGTFIGRLTGANTATTRLGAMLGGNLVGYGQMIAVLVAIAGLLWVWDKFTNDTKEATKALQEFQKSDAARLATSTSLGTLNNNMTGSGMRGIGADIPALTEDAKKASEAARILRNDLLSIADAGGTGTAGGAFAGGPSKALRDLAADLVNGKVDATAFNEALSGLPKNTLWEQDAQKVAKWGAELITINEQLSKVNATVEQATTIQRFYTQEIGATNVKEGELLEKIQQREAVLKAFQTGGVLAGKEAENNASAFDAAKTMYEDYAKSGKDATLATLAFQDALKRHNPVAEAFYNEQRKLLDVNTQIANAQKQATAGTSDDNRFTAMADQIERFAAEAQAFGKDASIDNRVRGMDDSLDHFITTMQQQVATGKLSQSSFDQQAAAVEDLRQRLNSAGVEMKSAFDEQTTKKIDEQYVATKQLFDSLVDGTGSYHELTAAKQAQMEIDRLAKQLGHDLSDEQQQQIRDTYAYNAAITDAKTAQTLEQRAVAIQNEIDAIKSGASTRATYAADLLYQNQLVEAAAMAAGPAHDRFVQEAIDLHNKSVALDLLKKSITDAATAETKAAEISKQVRDEVSRLSSSIEKDLLGAVQRFANGGITSWSSFFKEAESLSIRMIEQLDSTIHKMSSSWADAFDAGDTALAASIDKQLRQYEKFREDVSRVAAGVSGAMAGYTIGQQSGSTVGGIVGGAASGAVSGFAIAGPWGAAIGGLAGAAGGLLGAADAQQKAAQALHDAAAALQINVATFEAQGRSPAEQSLASLNAQQAALYKQAADVQHAGGSFADYRSAIDRIDAAYARDVEAMRTNFFDDITAQLNALDGPSGNFLNQLAALSKAYDANVASAHALGASTEQLTQIDELYQRQVKQLADAQAEATSQITESLDAREAYAKGLTAEGDATTRRAAEEKELFDDEQAGYTAEQLARVAYIQGLEDQKKAEDDARAALERYTVSVASLTAQFLSLTGQTDAAAMATLLEQQRVATNALVTANAPADEMALNGLVQLFQRGQLVAQQQIAAQTAVLNAQLKTQQTALQTAQTTLQTLQQAASSLATFRDSLATGSLSPLSPGDQLAASKAQLDKLYAAAQGGDATAAGQFSGAANTYLQLARGYYASTTGYADAFSTVQQMSDTLATQFATQATLQQQMVDSLQAQVNLLTAELAQLQDANTIAQMTRDAVITELQKSRDATLTPNAALIDQMNALRDTLSGVGRDIVSSERDILVGDRNNVMKATQDEINAINAGASAQQLATLDAVRLLDLQKTSMDDGFANQIAAMGKAFGFDSPQVMEIVRLQQIYDAGVQAQIDAINGVTAAIGVLKPGDPSTMPIDRPQPGGPIPRMPTSPLTPPRDPFSGGSLYDPYTGGTFTLPVGQTAITDILGNMFDGTNWRAAGTFANGGDFAGGMRWVGERGPELEMTGASRITSSNDLSKMFSMAVGAGQESRDELRAQTRELKVHTSELQAVVRQAGDGYSKLVAGVTRMEGRLSKVESELRLARADVNTGQGPS